IASNITGNNVAIQSKGDITLTGTNAVSDNGTVVYSENGDIKVHAAKNFYNTQEEKTVKKSGLLGTGGIGFTIGQQKTKSESDNTALIHSGSMIGSLNGDTTIYAGKNYEQVGSDVVSMFGDVDVSAKDIQVKSAENKISSNFKQKYEQSGLTIALTGGVISMAESVANHTKAVVNSDNNGRVRSLNALSAYAKGTQLLDSAEHIYNSQPTENPSAAAAASGIRLSVSLGNSKSEMQSSSSVVENQGSVIKSGRDVRLTARDENINIQGSKVQALHNATFDAEKDIIFQAAADTEQNRSTNKSSSNSIGASVGVGSGGLSVNVDVSMSRGKGYANSDSLTWQNSEISAGENVHIRSGNDTTIKGAVVSADRVTGKIGGDLHIESLQDTSVGNSKQENFGVSVSIPVYGAGMASGSVSANKQKAEVNYKGVHQQSGINAKNGFDITVGGETSLTGAYILGSDNVEQNKLKTGSLKVTDLHNEMSVKSSSTGVSVGTASFDNAWNTTKTIASNLFNNGKSNESDNSDTTSAISAGVITVGGVTKRTDKETLTDKDGKTVATVNNHRSLEKVELADIQEKSQKEQENKMLVVNTVIDVLDDYMVKNHNPKPYKTVCLKEPCANDQIRNTERINEYAQHIQQEYPNLDEKEARELAIEIITTDDKKQLEKLAKKYSQDIVDKGQALSIHNPNRMIELEDGTRVENMQAISLGNDVEDFKSYLKEYVPDEKISVANTFGNGIMNGLQRATELSQQQSPHIDPSNNYEAAVQNGGVLIGDTYLVHIDRSTEWNFLSELLGVGITKAQEVLGIVTPAAKLKVDMQQAIAESKIYDRQNSIDHSRGTLNGSLVALEHNRRGFYDENMHFFSNNPAAKESRYQERVKLVTGSEDNLHTHYVPIDPVSVIPGGYKNKETGKREYAKSAIVLLNIIKSDHSPHSSPGTGAFGSETQYVPEYDPKTGMGRISYPDDISALQKAHTGKLEANGDLQKLQEQRANTKLWTPLPEREEFKPDINRRTLENEVRSQSNQDSKTLLDNLGNKMNTYPKSQSSSNERVNQLKQYLNE
ncbi:MAG: hemagglutinin repeat-containing protein, partial [Neisseriaceae bacterium]|nr:hemagglutinin repeat-containing protein [Neisseriaceae bacterium]